MVKQETAFFFFFFNAKGDRPHEVALNSDVIARWS